jgi:Domain of unknown function (DU1801)
MTDIEEFLSNLPRNEQLVSRRLRSIILECDPRLDERLSYGVPYFFRRRRVCFIWPASAPYGTKDGKVSLGFCYGCLMSDGQGLLKMEGRTQVSIARFAHVAEINERTITELVLEALLVDGASGQRKSKRKNG